ncbi:response regulator transcription factor [Amycolatopsis rhizosphaerae]|uniref:Response regulator transcription factor n=1 Tax=Amycolatopsis rhizosphaerae TaxID=2053003 RepID=A0A558BR17_9PSEU|nr:response regulator transcription factor [Amycolatopsis rhizosphaerae]TVT38952.1 response regulator transcription factor [Amycolatopsis rhizosphaerae]
MTAPAGRGLVLVVEDEDAIAELITLYLRRDGFTVHRESDGDAALAAVRRLRPVAVVLDIGLSGKDGVEVCRTLRASGDWTPVLFVTARDDEVDRLLGLELGADDYVTKPFSPRELAARVRTVLRRGAGTPAEVLSAGTVRLDVTRRKTWAGEREVTLTPTEFDLLAQLLRQPGRVFEREQLLSAVWGYHATAGTRTVDVHIAQLRAKLGEDSPIRTVRGVGYAAEQR